MLQVCSIVGESILITMYMFASLAFQYFTSPVDLLEPSYIKSGLQVNDNSIMTLQNIS